MKDFKQLCTNYYVFRLKNNNVVLTHPYIFLPIPKPKTFKHAHQNFDFFGTHIQKLN